MSVDSYSTVFPFKLTFYSAPNRIQTCNIFLRREAFYSFELSRQSVGERNRTLINSFGDCDLTVRRHLHCGTNKNRTYMSGFSVHHLDHVGNSPLELTIGFEPMTFRVATICF